MAAVTASTSGSNYLFKVVLVGDSGVGKSNLLSRFHSDAFYPDSKATIGVEFVNHSLLIDGRTVIATCWDTAGEERFRAISSAYYRGAAAAILVYDISSTPSFDSIVRWLAEVRRHATSGGNGREVVCLLLGNKSDLPEELRQIDIDTGYDFALRNRMLFMEASALDGTNVEDAFHTVLAEVFRQYTGVPVEMELAVPVTTEDGQQGLIPAGQALQNPIVVSRDGREGEEDNGKCC